MILYWRQKQFRVILMYYNCIEITLDCPHLSRFLPNPYIVGFDRISPDFEIFLKNQMFTRFSNNQSFGGITVELLLKNFYL